MLLLPKRIKFTKSYSRKTLSMRAFLPKPFLKYGQQGLISNNNSFLISHQINAALRPIRKHLKKQAKI
jgi:ribosomal protein L16/L10AE